MSLTDFKHSRTTKLKKVGHDKMSAIVLAGGLGSKLFPLPESKPKPLLPLSNKPMIFYVLNYLEKSGFDEVIVIYTTRQEESLEKYLHPPTDFENLQDHEYYSGEMNIVTKCVDDKCGDIVSALRSVAEYIHHDFLVMPCDLITDFDLEKMFKLHRVKGSTITMLLKEKDSLSQHKSSTDYIAVTEDKRVSYYSKSIEKNITLDRSFFVKWSQSQFSTQYTDMHVYIFSKWVMEFLLSKSEMESLQFELIPYIVQHQLSSKFSSDILKPTKNHLKALQFTSSFADLSDLMKVYASIVPEKGYCKRVNTIDLFLEVNRQLAQGAVKTFREFKVYPSKEKNKEPKKKGRPPVQIGKDCCIAEGLKLGTEITIKKSCVQDGVSIGSNVKIINSVIMENVVIGDNVQISNSIICDGAYVSENVELDGCKVAKNVRVGEGKYLNDIMTPSEMPNLTE